MNWVKISALIFTLSFLWACGSGNESESSDHESKHEEDSTSQAVEGPRPNAFTLQAYYPFDDKYHDTAKQGKVSAFLSKRSAELKSGAKTYNLLQPKTRTPINGEWNPSTDIWIGVELRENQSADQLKLTANGEEVQRDTLIEQWSWHRLERSRWEDLAKPMKETDIPNVYNAEYLKQVDSLKLQVRESFTVGEIIYLNATLGSDTLKAYLRMRFGE